MLSELLQRQMPGHALLREFYRDEGIYQQDLDRIILKSWVLVGHASQIPEVGQYFVSSIAGESLIIVHGDDGQINALLNVCRHRGSRVCLEQHGQKSRFVCPYHAWTYGLDGNLIVAPRMPDAAGSGEYGLKRARLENFQGLLFINFDLDADFSEVAEEMSAPLKPYDIENTKVAFRQNYDIHANWKLAVENFCECYHCMPAHREFSVGHGLANPDKATPESYERVLSKADACGLYGLTVDKSFNAEESNRVDRYFVRYPLMKGHVTGSRDGKPVAPLLGTVKDYDGGATDFQIGALSYGLAYCDYVVMYRFIPQGVDRTDCEVIWLVREDAVEGVDFGVDDLTWMWDVTTKADKRIIQDNARGVASRFYEPGPFASMEKFARQFNEWYLNVLVS